MQVNLCKELEEVKKQDQVNYEKIIRILKFIYKTVGEDYFKKKIDSLQLSEEIYQASRPRENSYYRKEKDYYVEFKTDLFRRYIESNGGITDMLFEIVKEPDFFKYLFEKIDISMTMLECGIKQNTATYTYVYNLYAMLKIYQKKNYDFDAFKLAIDDIAYLFIDTSAVSDFRISDKKTLIDKIISNEFYPYNALLRGLMIRTISEARKLKTETEEIIWNSVFTYLNELSCDKRKFEKLGYVGGTINPEIFDVITNNIIVLVSNEDEFFYDPILLFKDRYKTLNEEIKAVGVNHREEVFSYFINLDINLFEELNQKQEQDSFDECIKNIFNSDTYSELYSKLKSLSEANSAYRSGDKSLAFSKIKDLDSDQHKEVLLGRTLTFSTDDINKVEKPKTISKRTKTLYLKNDLVPENFNWDILDSNLYHLTSLKERLDAEVFDYNIGKISTLLEQKAPPKTEEAKEKKKNRFNFFG